MEVSVSVCWRLLIAKLLFLSHTGKRLLSKCRQLHQENEDLRKSVSSGKIAKLEGDLALHRSFAKDMKNSQTQQDAMLVQLDNEVPIHTTTSDGHVSTVTIYKNTSFLQLENMQSVLCNLQKELKGANKMIADLRGEPAPSGSQDDDEGSAMEIDTPSTSRGHQSWSSSRMTCSSPPLKISGSNIPSTDEVC